MLTLIIIMHWNFPRTRFVLSQSAALDGLSFNAIHKDLNTRTQKESDEKY